MSALDDLDPVEETRLKKLDVLHNRATDELRAAKYDADAICEMENTACFRGADLRAQTAPHKAKLSPGLWAEIEAIEPDAPDEDDEPARERTPVERRFDGLLSDVCTALEAGSFAAVAEDLYERRPADLGELRERVKVWKDDLPEKLQLEIWHVPAPTPIAVPAVPAGLAVATPGARHAEPLPIGRVRPSLRQPRQGRIDVSDIQPSIAAHGLLSPIWVRTVTYAVADPTTGATTYYELVFGERRLIACTNLGWKTIDAEIHDELSDLDVFLIQSDENEKRRPLTPLEQADQVARLHRPESDDEGFGLAIGEIALRLGIGESTAQRRLLLSQLGTTGRDLLTEGKILLGTALALAAMPVADQDEAAPLVAPIASGMSATGKPRSLSDVEHVLDGRFHLRVHGERVPFDPARDDLAGAPPCAACPKRIDGQRQGELFERSEDFSPSAVDEDARCPDRKCHRAKADQTWDEAYEEAAAKGLRILDKAETKRLFAGSTFMGGAARLKDLGDSPSATEIFGVTTYAKLLGDLAPPVALIRDPAGQVRWLADWSAVETGIGVKTAEAKGKPVPKAKAPSTSKTAAAAPAPAFDAAETAPSLPGGKATPTKPAAPAGPDPVALEREGEEAAGLDALAVIVEKAAKKKLNAGFWRFLIALVVRLASRYFKGGLAAVVERRLLRKDEEVMTLAAKKHATAKGTGKVTDALVMLAQVEKIDDEDDARALLVELLAASEGFHHFGEDEDSDVLHLACRFFGLDLGDMKDTAIASLKSAKKKAAKKAADKAAKDAAIETVVPADKAETPAPAASTKPAAAKPASPKASPAKHEGPVTVEHVAAHFLELLETGDGWMLEALEERAAKHFEIADDDASQETFIALVDAAEVAITAPGGGAKVTSDALLVLVAPRLDDKPKRKFSQPLAPGMLRGWILSAIDRHVERAGKKAGLTIEEASASLQRDMGEIPAAGKKVLAKAFESLIERGDVVLGEDEKIRRAPPKALPDMPAAKGA